MVDRVLSFSGDMMQRGQNEFHSFQVLVLRTASSTTRGLAEIRLLARRVNIPSFPYVGVEIAGTREATTPEVGVGDDSVVGGYIAIFCAPMSSSRSK